MKKIEEKISISTDYIKLDQFLKWSGIADNGSHAKELIKNEKVLVNNEVETRRGKKLIIGDRIEFLDKIYILTK